MLIIKTQSLSIPPPTHISQPTLFLTKQKDYFKIRLHRSVSALDFILIIFDKNSAKNKEGSPNRRTKPPRESKSYLLPTQPRKRSCAGGRYSGFKIMCGRLLSLSKIPLVYVDPS